MNNYIDIDKVFRNINKERKKKKDRPVQLTWDKLFDYIEEQLRKEFVKQMKEQGKWVD